MSRVFHQYNDLLNQARHHMSHPYKEGDCIFIDNLAIAHRAAPAAHQAAAAQGVNLPACQTHLRWLP